MRREQRRRVWQIDEKPEEPLERWRRGGYVRYSMRHRAKIVTVQKESLSHNNRSYERRVGQSSKLNCLAAFSPAYGCFINVKTLISSQGFIPAVDDKNINTE